MELKQMHKAAFQLLAGHRHFIIDAILINLFSGLSSKLIMLLWNRFKLPIGGLVDLILQLGLLTIILGIQFTLYDIKHGNQEIPATQAIKHTFVDYYQAVLITYLLLIDLFYLLDLSVIFAIPGIYAYICFVLSPLVYKSAVDQNETTKFRYILKRSKQLMDNHIGQFLKLIFSMLGYLIVIELIIHAVTINQILQMDRSNNVTLIYQQLDDSRNLWVIVLSNILWPIYSIYYLAVVNEFYDGLLDQERARSSEI